MPFVEKRGVFFLKQKLNYLKINIMEIYLVISCSGEYEDYREQIEKAFFKEEDAINYKKEFDDEHIIKGDVFNIMPESIYYEYPTIDEIDGPIEEYKGYTSKQYKEQEDRLYLSYAVFRECKIQKINIE